MLANRSSCRVVMPARRRSLPWLCFVCALLAPRAVDAERPKQELGSLSISSTAFAAQREIPSKYTCEGADISPPLSWDGVPEDAQSLVLIVEDPDAPDPATPLRTWVHWIVLDLPPTTRGLREDARELPAGALDGVNDAQRTGYSGPCPPRGRHRYFFRLYALDTKLRLVKPQRAQLEEALAGHVIARAELVGTYEKKKRTQAELPKRRGPGQP